MSTCKGKIFKNEQHAANIASNLCKFYEESMFLDVVLLSEGMKIEAHKNVLAASSGYFLQLFQDNKTVETNQVEIKEIKGTVLKIIIDFMYSGWILMDLENIEVLLRGAIILKITKLVKGCCDFIQSNLDKDNSVRWFILGKRLCLSDLKDKCLKFIHLNFQQVTKTSDFLFLNLTTFMDILFDENRSEGLEEQVFLGLVAWVQHDRNQREGLLSDLLPMVRYQFLSSKLICENRKSICTSETFELVMNWLEYHSSSAASTSIEDKEITKADKEQPHTKDEAYNGAYTMCSISQNSASEFEIETYDEKVKTWSLKKRIAPFANHFMSSSTIHMDDNIFIVGGKNSSNIISKNVTCLDLRTFEVTNLPAMQVGRRCTQLVNVKGNLCVFGGFDVKRNFIESIEVFNFSTKTWSFLQPPIKPRIGQRIVSHKGNLSIFDISNGSLQCYDTFSGKWTSYDQPIIDGVSSFYLASDGKFLYGFFNLKSSEVVSIQRFDFSTNSWIVIFECKKIDRAVLLLDDLKIWKLNDRWILHNLEINKIVVSRTWLTQSIFPYQL